jgi:hypothetical protein
MSTVVEWQWLRCLKSGKFYPDYAGRAGPVGLRYCGAGDLIFVKPDDVQWLLGGGLCERYTAKVKDALMGKNFPMLDMTLGMVKTKLRNLKELVSALCDKAFGDGIEGAINWADLECVETSFCINADGEIEYRALVEEAGPVNLALHDYIVDGLEKRGFDMAHLTIETAW